MGDDDIADNPIAALGFAFSWCCQQIMNGNDLLTIEVPLLLEAWQKACDSGHIETGSEGARDA